MGRIALPPPSCPEPAYSNGGAICGKSLDSNLVERRWRAERERSELRRKQAEEQAQKWRELLVFMLYVTASGVVGVLVSMAYVIMLLDTGPFRTGGWF